MRQKPAEAQHVQRFAVIRPLGRGGFGTVSEAVDQSNGQRVALKELTRVSPSALFRFKQEFRALAGIQHPNLVRLDELIEQEGRWYIVMELIEGVDLLQYVARADNDSSFDEERLRTAFAGIAEGLEALHAYGVLHRDLKPSNALVTPEGRAVLLDFGLVTSVDSRAQSTHVGGMGTILYMAPEQVDGQKLGRATDWYAFGSSLYEALTGKPPFHGDSALRIALAKQRLPPAHPDTLVQGLPADLSELCMRLLQIAPQSRPRGPEVLRILRREAPRESIPCPPSQSLAPPGRMFAGRDTEMEHLERALARTHEGELRIVLVEGESGVGKSELVAEFLRRQEQHNPSSMALRGRCYQNEQVSYKAFDGCIDELARHLRRMGKDAATLMPVQAPLLAQLFPVLADVQTLTRARTGTVAADPTARRLQAFGALAALLGSLAEERPVILVIDDLQWADSESFRMLRALVEDQARPPILVLATVRARDELEGDVLASIERVREWKCTDVVSLLGLARPQAEALAKALLGPEQDPSWASTIAVESRGHPLLLAELIRFTQSRDLRTGGLLTLEAALTARIERLPKEARAVLEIAALAARPHSAQLFARALERPRIDEAIRMLVGGKLLRTRRDQEVGCFHDRIRQVAVGLIPGTRLPHLHRRLALALAEKPSSDATEEATHWDRADEPERALEAYERAAKRAFETLAFTQAERLLARALELATSPQHKRYAGLVTERAHALACAGRSAEAATLYQKAAELSTDEEQRLRLRSRTALQLMLSGSLQTGLEACRTLVAQLGVSMPRSDWGSVVVALWHRLWTRFRNDVALPKGHQDPKTKLTFELLDEQTRALTIIDTSSFLVLSAQFARAALRAGNREHVRSAYSFEGWLRNARAGILKAGPLFATARQLGGPDQGSPRLRALLACREGSARLASRQWTEGTALMQEAEHICETECPNDPWLHTVIRYHLGAAWYRTGEHAHLARKTEAWIHEARERKDRFAVALLSGMGQGVVRHLMRGKHEEALEELIEAMSHLPDKPFGFAHFGHMTGMQSALSLQGGRAAWDWFEQRKKQHGGAFLLKTRFGRETLLLLRSSSALRALEVASPTERDVLIKHIRRSTRELQRGDSPFTLSFAALYAAQLAALHGELEGGLRLARKARLGFDKMGDVWSHGALYLEGLLEGGASGKARCAEVLAFFENQGWAQPEHAVLLYLPTLPLLSRGGGSLPAPRRRMIQHYEVLSSLGSGGFGSVVNALDTRSGEHVALKELVSKSARSLERFKQEFRALRDLHHPNLVRVDALLEHEARWYIAMELVHGQDLVSYVRPQGKLDVERLRVAFRGLLAALRALHEAGLVHRDLSADNVCVSSAGRAVLLDFGLVAREHDAGDAEAVGNIDYAAPEQLEGAPPHHSADAYALGVCLYQALWGRLPLNLPRAPEAVLLKGARAPQQPSVPEPLAPVAACCLRLLSPEPAGRPCLRELAALLSSTSSERAGAQRASLVPVSAHADAALFAGRREELRLLHEAADRARSGFALALIEGESGLGKSALVGEFARTHEAQSPQLWSLGGRCYENERLSFKAFDGVVDELARRLRSLPSLDCEELLPRKAALLTQLFPVLGGVSAIADAPKKGLPADPGARRSLALKVFVELLERVAHGRPLLVLIDDLQWADDESLALLHGLAARAEALPILVVATLRPAHELSKALCAQIDHVKALPSAGTLTLGRLDAAATEALAQGMLGPDVSAGLVARLAEESQGHPLFLRELVEHTRAGDFTSSQGPVSLDEALSARIRRFEPQTRSWLALVALAGKPYPAHVFAAAMGEAGAPSDVAALHRAPSNELLAHGLLRRRGDTSLGCYHDRVRHVAQAALGGEERQRFCARLAAALDLHHPHETAERARLWDEAGHVENACAAHEEAGDAALEKLAFAQAEQHYARSLELAGDPRDERWLRLTVQRAHTLVRMGKNAAAARAYAAGAEAAEGERRVRLRIWAAQNLIQGAEVSEGLDAAARLLDELGISLAHSDANAVRRIVWEGLRLKLRGIDLRASAAELAPAQRLALDALNELAQPVASVQFLQGAALSAQHVRRALHAGGPAHAARALAYEGMLRSTRKPLVDHSSLFERATELAESTGDPTVMAWVLVRHGAACLGKGDFLRARELLVAGHELIVTQCPGQPWLLTTARTALGTAFQYLGDHKNLAAQSEDWIADARAREDRYGYASIAGSGAAYLRHLMRDAPDAVDAELTQAMGPWPEEPFSVLHFGALVGSVLAHLYRGGSGALDWFERNRARLERATILRNPIFRLPIASARANACFAAMDGTAGARNLALLQVARQQVPILRKQSLALTGAIANLVDAALFALEGDSARSLSALRSAQPVLAAAHHVNRLSARYLEGWLEGGPAGAAKAEEALAARRAEGWVDPRRSLHMLLPIFHLLPLDRSQPGGPDRLD